MLDCGPGSRSLINLGAELDVHHESATTKALLIVIAGLATVLAVALGLLLPRPMRAHAQSTEPVADPVAVISAWVAALAAHDLDAAVSLLDDDAFVNFLPPPGTGITTYEGKEEIRRLLQNYEVDKVQVRLLEAPRVVNGTVTWIERQSADSLRQSGVAQVDVRADAIVEGGRIRSVVYELTPESAGRVEAAGRAPSRAPTGMPRTGEGTPNFAWMVSLVWLGAMTVFAGLGLRSLTAERS